MRAGYAQYHVRNWKDIRQGPAYGIPTIPIETKNNNKICQKDSQPTQTELRGENKEVKLW